ncbi:hypothetical protein PAXRUDRAFT_27603 [Paxillus rubicundulus Ve08.2h10]|uniref:Uncharacterized protein n=1 Tax=Paxillus rubicundulus Ve08.2h10 TaxID=930991 RepID=A0A0D0D2V4_9AGAM|nr:hypothetical protein PAXRUDRAFT_27603 [Paxillus rubicundulus Ve08.2h10]
MSIVHHGIDIEMTTVTLSQIHHDFLAEELRLAEEAKVTAGHLEECLLEAAMEVGTSDIHNHTYNNDKDDELTDAHPIFFRYFCPIISSMWALWDLTPTTAIKLECLELYQQLCQLSIQAMTKVLCALHNMWSVSKMMLIIVLESRLVKQNMWALATDNWAATKLGEEDQIHIFTETSIFLLACWHGFVELIVEMKWSGELAKYALAAISQVLEICGIDQAIGHNIGCKLKKSITTSSLGAKAKE